MSIPTTNDFRSQVEAFSQAQRTGLVTLVFTDIVGSTGLKRQIGDRAALVLFHQHDEIIRQLLESIAEGREIETAGDSFFLAFATPSAAVKFALLLQRRLRNLGGENARSLPVRIGIHLGEVLVGSERESLRDLFGLQIDTCARVMSLAKGGQILMTRAVFDSARQVLKGEDIGGVGSLNWLNHGSYDFKGLDEPVEVCETSELENARLSPPTDSDKARRTGSPDSEPVLGWRPAVSQAVPNTRWVLEEQLGKGGFGEVWLGCHQLTKEHRVFKFCFEAGRARFLKRELTLFRVLKERIGGHPNIVRLYDFYLEEAPFYVEMDYVPGKDLRTWSERNGGIGNIPLETRLEIIIQAADALQAAHDAGIIHRDIKPANILVSDLRFAICDSAETKRTSSTADSPRRVDKSEIASQKSHITAKLTDFGIGQVTSEEALAGLTRMGFTQTMVSPGSSSHAGTQLYMAPELIEGKPPTALSDIYALGLVLYQVVIGDFVRTIAPGWERDVADSLLREDIAACVDGSPERRLASARELAVRLRGLGQRRDKLEAEQKLEEEAERAEQIAALARRRRRQFAAASVAGVTLTIIVAVAALREFGLRRQAEDARGQAEQAKEQAEEARAQTEAARREAEYSRYLSQIQAAVANLEAGNNLVAQTNLLETLPEYRGWEWGYLAGVVWPPPSEIEPETVFNRAPGLTLSEFWANGTPDVIIAFEHQGFSSLVTAFNHDGTRIVASQPGGAFGIREARTGRILEKFTLDHHASFLDVSFSHDGSLIAMGITTGDTLILNGDTYDIVWTLQDTTGATPPVNFVRFSSDMNWLAACSWDGTVRVWNPASGKLVARFEKHSQPVSLRFSPDGKTIVSASKDGTVRVWETETGHEIEDAVLAPGPTGLDLSAHTLSPNLRDVAAAFIDGSIVVWDRETGERRELAKGSEPIERLVFSPDGTCLLAVGDRKSVRVLDVASETEVASIVSTPFDFPMHVSFSPNGDRILISSLDGMTRLWGPTVLQTKDRSMLSRAHDDLVLQAAFSPNGTRIVTASYDKKVRAWDAATQELMTTFDGHQHKVLKAEFSPDGRRVASFSIRGTVRVWDAATGEEIFSLPGSDGFFSSASAGGGARGMIKSFSTVFSSSPFTQSGNLIVYDGRDMLVHDGRNGSKLYSLEQNPAVGWPVIGPLDKRVATVTDRLKEIWLWNLTNGDKLYTLPHEGKAFWVAFSPDGTKLVTGFMGDYVIVWDVEQGEELFRLKGHGMVGHVFARFSPDGRRIATASLDGQARIWDASTGKFLATCSGHPSWVNSVEFSPDGSRLLTISRDDTARLWDLSEPTAREVLRLSGDSELTYATWSPDGRQILTCWKDGSVRLFETIPWPEFAVIGDASMDMGERIRLWREKRSMK